MKKYNIKVFPIFFAILLLLTTPIDALAQASDYIHYYQIDVSTSGQKINTSFRVIATGKMSKLGAHEIKIYEYPYNDWNLVDTRTEYDSGMTGSNMFSYNGTVTYTAQTNKNYKVVVTIFARDASGSDSRTETYYVST